MTAMDSMSVKGEELEYIGGNSDEEVEMNWKNLVKIVKWVSEEVLKKEKFKKKKQWISDKILGLIMEREKI